MRAPAFWYTPPDRPGLTARLLSPLGRLTAAVSARYPRRPVPTGLPVPVICIETLTPGANDLTPAAITLLQHLEASGHTPVVACEGGHGRQAMPVEVDPKQHSADDVGDDALLIAAFARVWVARDIVAAARSAAGTGATTIIIVGATRRHDLSPAISMIVVDAIQGFGNGLCLPAGPLREPVASALTRADLLLSIGPPRARRVFEAYWTDVIDLPHLRGQLVPLETGMDWKGASLLAFAGIDNPEGFFAILRGLGANLVRAEALENHQPLTRALMSRLEGEAKTLGAQPVTTERDAVRLPAEFRSNVLTLPIRLQIEDSTALDRMVAKSLQ